MLADTCVARHTRRMIISRFNAVAGGLALVASALVLTGCAGGSDPVGGNTLPPIIKTADELQGATVEINSKQPLSIDTGSLPVESYSVVSITPGGVVEFVAGNDDGSATFNPGISALKEGTAEVELKNAQGGIQNLKFTVEVVAAP